MSDEPTTLSEALAAAEKEKEGLKERLRASEAEAGKVPALTRNAENQKRQFEGLRNERDSLKTERDNALGRVSELESNARAESEDAAKIEALEQQLAAKGDEVDALKADFSRQADEHNAVSQQLANLEEQVNKAGAAMEAARLYKQFTEILENLE